MVPSALLEVFPELIIFTNLFSTKRDTRKIFVDIALGNLGNHFVVKWLLKSSVTKSFLLTYLLHLACLIQCNTALEQTSRSKNCRHFISVISFISKRDYSSKRISCRNRNSSIYWSYFNQRLYWKWHHSPISAPYYVSYRKHPFDLHSKLLVSIWNATMGWNELTRSAYQFSFTALKTSKRFSSCYKIRVSAKRLHLTWVSQSALIFQ